MELWRNVSQRGLLIATYDRLKGIFWWGHNSCSGGSSSPWTLGTARVSASQPAVSPSCPTLTRAELPLLDSCVCALRVSSVVSDTFLHCRLWQDSLSGSGFSMWEYWSMLANTDHRTLLEHYITFCPNRQNPEWLAMSEPLWPKQLHHLHTWPSQGQTQSLLRSKSQWTNHMQSWK